MEIDVLPIFIYKRQLHEYDTIINNTSYITNSWGTRQSISNYFEKIPLYIIEGQRTDTAFWGDITNW